MKRDDFLFGGNEINQVLEHQRRQLISEVESQGANYLLNVSEDDYVKHLVEKYSIRLPALHADKRQIHATGDSQIDVRGRHDYWADDEGKPVYVAGTYVTVALSFDGQSDLFNLTLPSTHYQHPRGAVVGNEIHLTYSKLPQDQGAIQNEMTNDIQRIERCVNELRGILEPYNQGLERIAREAIAKRKTKLLADAKLLESLGIPLKKNPNTAETYTVPLVRTKLRVERPTVVERGYTPEPIMPPDDYEHILQVIKHLSLVIERNPHTFVDMQESDIRNIILVLLNAVYEGTATGETFNGSGKTDILLRHEGKNLFIAECKFWEGEQSFLEAIDQLLKYVTWRDTKTALVIFNRNRDTSAVLAKVKASIKGHQCHKKELGQQDETILKYRFCRKDDPNRDFFLTVMVFDVPSSKEVKETGQAAKVGKVVKTA